MSIVSTKSYFKTLYYMFVTLFIGSNIRRRSLMRSAKDALLGGVCFFLGGFVPFVIGISIRNMIERDFSLFVLTSAITALVLMIDYFRKKDDQHQPHARTYWILGVCIVFAIAAIVFFADQANQLRSASKTQNKT